MVGGDGAKMRAHAASGHTICGEYIGTVLARAGVRSAVRGAGRHSARNLKARQKARRCGFPGRQSSHLPNTYDKKDRR